MKKGKRIMIFTMTIVCFLLFMIIFMQFKVVRQSEEINIDLMQEAELRQELTSWKSKYEETKQRYDEVAQTLDSYKQESSTDNKTKETLEAELEGLELALGKTDVEGEGVIIKLTEKTESELGENEKQKLIEANDLIYIVNYLKDSGAEAISINDERIVNTTYIVDIGETIKINGKYIRTSTYEIKAIGNRSYLESSIFGKDGYAEQLNSSGVRAECERQNKIKISKYNEDFETKYMEEAK